ncbi:class I SAM-dependent methyltransferase [Dyella acidiphila]|uniref:S-adenosyl-L-methionine-dependent methyltransferase n=1 Tax=Dyella acidiphila TaxID=2775866 RepID=A0ABR9G7L9_9GAMM|nr:SAM-dependent methyltransferase [Dyella acidiphila]MBE1160045.1 class I SAM-dependent methyltransferase [Dyella acidiphila]
MAVTSENIIQTGKPSRTAWLMANLRAVHQLLDQPLVLDDPVALRILGTEAAALLRDDPYVYNDPFARGLRAILIVRSRVAEDELLRSVAAGARQYVVLGAGLDTFAYRNPHRAAGLRVFEVDHPSTQQWKRRCLRDAGIALPRELVFAPIDFERGTLAQGLAEAGFRSDVPACFSWLGVTMYLSEEAVLETLRFVATLPQGSSISFDYHVPESMRSPVQRIFTEVLGQRAAAAGEPWICEFDPALLRQRLLQLGFSAIEDFSPEALNRRYLDRRKDGLHMGGRIMCARV